MIARNSGYFHSSRNHIENMALGNARIDLAWSRICLNYIIAVIVVNRGGIFRNVRIVHSVGIGIGILSPLAHIGKILL